MTDIFPKRKRGEIMSHIKSKNTAVELLVFRHLRARGISCRKHYSRISGNPDVALPRKKKAIFIDGDFWHGHRFTKLKKRLPRKYWLVKIENNIKRDKKNRAKLKKDGWKILRIWEHDLLKRKEESLKRIVKFLTEEKQSKFSPTVKKYLIK